jgi:hypothetical protein
MLEYQNFRARLTTTDRDVAILKAASLVLAQPALAQKARVQNEDIITPLNGVAITDRRTLVAEADTLREGGRASLSYQRDGRSRSGETVAMSRPKEAKSVAVPFCGGLLRDIMVMPARVGSSAPAVYLLQGYDCGSMEGAQTSQPCALLVQELAERRIASYRVEEASMVDSQDDPPGLDSHFDIELDAFRPGLKALIDERDLKPNRAALLWRSMGGV